MLIHLHQFFNNLRTSPARKNSLILICVGLGLLINILIWALIYLKLQPVVQTLAEEPAFIPLHYNIYLGVDLFGNWHRILWLPGVGLFILLLNGLLAFRLFNRKKILSYFLAVSAVFSQILLLVASLFIILINI